MSQNMTPLQHTVCKVFRAASFISVILTMLVVLGRVWFDSASTDLVIKMVVTTVTILCTSVIIGILMDPDSYIIRRKKK